MGLPGRIRSACLLLVGVAFLVGVALWPELPDDVALQYVDGEPTTTAPRWIAVGLVPALLLASLAFVEGAVRIDPPGNERVLAVVVVGTFALVGLVHVAVLLRNVGYDVSVTAAFWAVIAWGLLATGYAVWVERLR